MTPVTTPIPPQNRDAEETVLGALMLAEAAFEKVADSGLRPGDFYRESNGVIFQTAVELHESGVGVDAITLAKELHRKGRLDKAGGEERIHELATLVPAWSNVGHHAKIVREAAVCRSLIAAGQNIVRLGFEQPGELDEVLAQAESELTKAVAPASSTGKAQGIAEGLDEMIAEIRQAYMTGEAIMGLTTGFRALDDWLSGLWPGQSILIAARPGNGKSTLALNIAENVSDLELGVLFVTLEMSKEELTIRSLARAAKVDSRVLATGQMKKEQAEKLPGAIATLKARTDFLKIQHDGMIGISGIRAEARRMKRDNLALIVVDYLQLMQGGNEENRQQQITTISRNLKLLARELDVPIISLSQMSRSIESRAEKRPQLSDLRESGSLEQDADVVMFIHSDSQYDPDKEDDGTVEVIVAKNRKGPLGVVNMTFSRRLSTFGESGAKSE